MALEFGEKDETARNVRVLDRSEDAMIAEIRFLLNFKSNCGLIRLGY